MNLPDEIAQWPPALRQCPICGGQGVEAALAIHRGGEFGGVEATCGTCTFTVESSEPEALRSTIEMFAEGGRALARAIAARAGPERVEGAAG